MRIFRCDYDYDGTLTCLARSDYYIDPQPPSVHDSFDPSCNHIPFLPLPTVGREAIFDRLTLNVILLAILETINVTNTWASVNTAI
jgi:hypothetical protein